MLMPALNAFLRWFRDAESPLRTFTALGILILAVAPGLYAGTGEDLPVMVQEIREDNWDQLVPAGKEVDAIYGDIALQNAHLRAVIAQPGSTRNANMTVRSVGGCLIDLTTRDHESDQLSAFYPGRRAFALSGVVVESESSASADSNGKVTATGKTTVAVKAEGSDEKPAYTVSYSLDQDAHSLTVSSAWTNTTAADLTLKLEDDLRADGGKEDMPKAPDETHDLFWFHDIYWQQAYGVYAPGYRIRCNSNTRESVLVYEPIDGKPVVVKPGESFTLARQIFVNRDLPGVLADFDEARGMSQQLTETRLIVLSHGRAVAGARVAIRCGDQDRGTLVTDEHGSADVRLPVGECSVKVSIAGQEFESQKLEVANAVDSAIQIPKYTSGIAHITVTDFEGRAIPAKVEFKGSGDTHTPNWGPETAEFFVRNLAYTPNGIVDRELASGEYDLTISHGPEYNAEFTKLKIVDGRTSILNVKIARVVETPGWVSSDFHSHSTPSGDNTSSQLGRVLNLAAEQIEFAPCTEHNRISTYSHHIDAMKLQTFLATVSGMELTGSPLPLNHQNVFPLNYQPRTQDGGAPVTDVSPEAQIERIAAWDNNSVKLIQQNHPDIGWLFYDQNGDQIPDEGYSRSFGLMNVVEIHPIDPLLNPARFEIRGGKPVGNQTALNWLQLLNQGFRIYGVVNTDAHYNFHGSGGLRIWIRSTADDPAKINSDEMRDAARNGHIVMSTGPYLEASFRETGSDQAPVISGQDLVAKSKKVTASIRIQCPNWFDVDTVFVLVNGRRSDKLTFTREAHPDLFSKETVRFTKSVDFDLSEDAHLVVVTGHRTQVLGDIMGPDWGKQHPTAVSNPVYVDIDGDGFKANRDTLDIPLPVKFAAAQ